MNETPKTDPTANREYKDSVFTLLFRNEEIIKDLYGAIKGTTYGPNTKIELTTLTNTIYKGRANDLSFVLDGKLVVLIEHQSTLNDNIPLRMLFYITELYNQLIKGKNIYGRKKVHLPTPEFIVLYNGTGEMPDGDEQILRLSDVFIERDPARPINLELTVKMYNINKGHNEKIQKHCAALYGYGIFIDKVREYQKTMPLEEAFQKAVADCIAQNILKDFLIKYGKELYNMFMTEWDWDVALKVERAEGWEDGVEEGRKEGMEKGKQKGMQAVFALLEKGYSPEEAKKKLQLA